MIKININLFEGKTTITEKPWQKTHSVITKFRGGEIHGGGARPDFLFLRSTSIFLDIIHNKKENHLIFNKTIQWDLFSESNAKKCPINYCFIKLSRILFVRFFPRKLFKWQKWDFSEENMRNKMQTSVRIFTLWSNEVTVWHKHVFKLGSL